MLGTSLTNPALRELAHRVSSGTDVTLFWNERTGVLTVSVRNLHAGAGTHIAVEPDKALYAFYHPYGYAAAQGLPCAGAPLASRS